MRRIFTILILYIACATTIVAQESAEQVVKRFLGKVEKETLVADFSISYTEEQAQPMNYTGAISMRGKCFVLNVFETDVAYDGKTMYFYSEGTDELTLTNPTPEELIDANPLLFAESLLSQSRVRFATTSPDGVYTIEFLPTDNSSVQKFVLKLKKSNLIPLEIQLREQTATSILKFRSAKYEATLPSFSISKPNAYINDLR